MKPLEPGPEPQVGRHEGHAVEGLDTRRLRGRPVYRVLRTSTVVLFALSLAIWFGLIRLLVWLISGI